MAAATLMRVWLFCVAGLLASSIWAATPSTQPATTQPWRPVPNREAGFGVLLSPGVAPCVVHVNALRFPLEKGTPLTAWYVWDFGDPRGRYNSLPGFNAAHIYEQPGTYTITLTVTDETGKPRSATANVVISPNRRKEIFVANNGSDFNAGTSPESPLRSVGKAFSLITEDCQVLLKAGGNFPASNVLKVNHSDVVISRYDEGPDPILMLIKQDGAKPPHGFISIDGKCNGITIQHLTFDTPYIAAENAEAPKIGIDGMTARGRNISVLDCTFLNVDNAVNANGSPVGLLVENCKAPLKTGLRAYLVWTQGSDFVCLGNVAANSTREHIVRLSGVERALIAANDFTNLDRRPGDKYDTSKGTIEMHNGSYAYITHNKVTAGTIRVGPLGLHEDAITATEWAVIEDNQLTNTSIFAYPGSHHVMIRNNIIRNDQTQAIVLQAPDKDGRMNADFHILNNTAIENGESGAFLKVWGRVDGIEMINNLLVAPHLKVGTNGAAAVNTAEEDLSSFSNIADNVWPAYSGDEFVIHGQARSASSWSKQDKFADIKLDEKYSPDSADANGDKLPGVIFDFYGHPRPETPSAGAVQTLKKNN